MEEHQDFERRWWHNCANTMGEELKQLTYADRMGLKFEWRGGPGPVIDMKERSVVDIGGGPVSMLLKCVGLVDSAVVDPCEYPAWVTGRYECAGIRVERIPAEHLLTIADDSTMFEEAWIYNCLQHTEDPERIIYNARNVAVTLRVFEWIDHPAELGHPHELKAELLDKWCGGRGTVEKMNENGCVGRAWYGVF